METVEPKAGRELDIAIAEKVMGWTRATLSQLQGDWWELPWAPGNFTCEPSKFSTDIAEAHKVVDHLVSVGWQFSQYADRLIRDEYLWCACFSGPRGKVEKSGATAAEAICRAALATVEELSQ